MAKKKTIKYLENGEYHDATVKDVGVIEELKTESKDNLVEAINEIFLGGGKGFSDLQQKVDESTQAAQNAQQAAGNLQQRLEEVAQNVGLSDEEARKIINQAVEDAKRAQAEALQAYKDAQKELDDSMAQFMEEQKAINKELEQAKSDIQGDIDQKNAEIEQINAVIESTKSDLTATSARLASVRNDLSNAQMDWGKVRQEITNINGKLDSKMSNTDFDEYKERIERNETEITQTKNELQSKATKQDLDVLTGTVTTQGSSITQLAGKIEQKVSKDTLANDIDDFQVKKANVFTGTREFMGWEFSDKALGRVNDDIYNHAKVAELHNGSNLSITVNGLEVGKTYSVSIFAKASANSNTSGVKVTVDNGKSYSGLMRTVYTPHDTKVTTNWQRYYTTIVASATTMKFVFDRSGMTSDITLYLNRPKLEVGETVYAWEDNAQDIYKRVEHTEAQFDVYNDQISGIVKKQTETDKKIENVSSTFTQRADGIEANSKKYTDDKATGLAEEFSGKLKATSQELSTEYEKQTNAKIGALADGGSNLILNSSFLVTDNNGNATLENWRDTSSKISLTKPNGLDGTWIKVNRATTGTALGARSNYFPVKQGKLVVGVDVALDGTGNISPYVLRIEYYDVSNNRVNYEDITLQKLGLSASQITKSGSNFRYARGVYKTSNDRSDVAKACIVVPETITGYDMYLTNFFAKFSDVNDGTYEVNPLDQQASLIKQRTKIEQDSEKINLLNTQTEKLGNDIKATNTSVNVLKGEVDLKASQSTVNDLTNRVAKNAADIKVFPDKIKSEVKSVSNKVDSVNGRIDRLNVGGRNLLYKTKDIDINNKNWQQKGSNTYYDKKYDKKAIHSWGNWSTYVSNQTIHLEANTDYVVSAYLLSYQAGNGGSNGSGILFGIYAKNTADNQTFSLGTLETKGKLSNTEWRRFSSVYHNDTAKDITDFRIEASGDWSTVSGNVWISEIKLETGNIATDYTPAPEDLQDGIDIATTKATQTDTKFERMISQIQYNDSTGEIGKYEHKITELANGTQEKISAIQTDGDKKLQSATQTLTNKIGDLESTVRTNTTNLGQYRQEMTNSAKEWSTKFTSVQTDMSSVSNKLDNLSQTNLYYNSEFTYTGSDPHNMDGIQSTRNVAYSKNDRWANYKGSNAVFASTRGTLNDYYYIEHRKDKYVKVQPGEVVSASVVTWVTGGSDVPRDGYALCTISFYKDLNSRRMGYKETSVAAKDINYPHYRTLKVENVTVPDGANYMALQLIIRGSSNWQFSQPMLVKSDKVGAYAPSTQLQLNQVADKTDSNTDKIEVLSGKITANSNEFSTVYTKITSAKNDAINTIKSDSQWQSMGKIVTNAAFLQNSDGFAQEVVKTTTPMVNGGGKNLARGTSDSWQGVGTQEFNGGTNFTKQVADVYLDDLNVGDKATVQIIYQYSGVTTSNAKAWLQGSGDVTGWNGGNFYGTPTTINMQTGTGVKHGSFKYTFDITSDAKKNRFWGVAWRFDNVNKGAWFQWLKFKVEKGKVATPWSPAPEDLATKLQLNDISSRTQFLQDNSQFLLRVQQAGAATGGVNNLLTNSDTFDGYSENNTNSFDFQKIEGSGLPSVPNQPSITMMGHVWDNYGSAYNKNDGIYLEKGETYWFGVYLMTDSNAGAFRNLSVYASSDKGQTSGSANKYFAGEVIDFNTTFKGKTKTWVWNTYQFTGDGTTRYNWRIEPYNHIGGSIWTAGYMLVKSPFPPTGWSPNMTDVQMRLDSGGVTINGNTKINGELSAEEVIIKSSDIPSGKPRVSINGYGLSIGNEERANDGVLWRYDFNKDGIKIVSDNDRTDAPKVYNYVETQGYIGNGFANANKNSHTHGRLNTGIELGLTPFHGFLGRDTAIGDLDLYGGDYIGIGEYKQNLDRIYNRDFKPGYLYIPYDMPNWVSNGNDPFFTEGYIRRGNADRFRRGNNLVGNTQFYPTDAEASIRVTWIAWSDWGNRKMPAIVNGNDSYGGIAFPKEGNVVMFNCKGMRFNMYAQDNQKYSSWGTWNNAAWGDTTD